MTDPASMPASASTPLGRRSADLARLADTTWDVLIVGGGIVGVGALLDAASRGLDRRPHRAGRHRLGDVVYGPRG